VNRTEWNRAARIDAADRRWRAWGTVAFILVVAFAMPGVYYLVYLQFAYAVRYAGMHLWELPGYNVTDTLFFFSALLSWLVTPIAWVIIAVGWTRLQSTARWIGAALCALATVGAVLSFLQLTMFGMRS
jgi:hypothetical protein